VFCVTIIFKESIEALSYTLNPKQGFKGFITNITTSMKQFSIVILIFALLLIVADYQYCHVFNIEGKYLITIIPLFVFDIYRRMKLTNRSIAGITSVGILAICLYQFIILFILAWGYSFLGAEWPTMWFLSVITTMGLVIISIKDIYRNTKHNSK
jgi:hypothetical protein